MRSTRILLAGAVVAYAWGLYLWARLLGPLPPPRVRTPAALVFGGVHAVLLGTAWWWPRAHPARGRLVLVVPTVWICLCVLLSAPFGLRRSAYSPIVLPLAQLAAIPDLEIFAAEVRGYGRIERIWRSS